MSQGSRDRPVTTEDLASMIRRRREFMGLTQEGLAAYGEALGFSQPRVSQWEKGFDLANHARFLEFLELLGVELKTVPLRLKPGP